MESAKVSSKYQVAIPTSVRDRLHLRPGERLQVVSFDDRIQLVRIRPMRGTRGFLKGFDARFERDEDDRV